MPKKPAKPPARQPRWRRVLHIILESPKEVPLFLLHMLILVIRNVKRIRVLRIFLEHIEYFVTLVFMTISPAIPPFLKTKWLQRAVGALAFFIIGALVGYLISYTLNYYGSSAAGTLIGADENRFYFLNDKKNLFIYRVSAPLYLGFSTAVIFLSVLYWSDLRAFADRFRKPELKYDDHERALAALIIMFLISVFFVQRYAYNVILYSHSVDGKQLYWFLDRSAEGTISYNSAGLFYLLAIYFKLFFLFVALACYVSIAIEWVRLISGVGKRAKLTHEEMNLYNKNIIACERIFLCFQCLFMILIWHGVTWGESYIGKKGANTYIATVFLLCCLLFFMALPRIYTRFRYRENPSRYPIIKAEGGAALEFLVLRTLNVLGYIVIYVFIFWPLLEKVTGRHFTEPLKAILEFGGRMAECWADPMKGC